MELPRLLKRAVALSSDICVCILSVWVAYYLRLGEVVTFSTTESSRWAVGISILIAVPIFYIYGLYRAVFRHIGWSAFKIVLSAVAAYALLYGGIVTVYGLKEIPRTIGIIQPIVLLLLVGTTRAVARLWLEKLYSAGIERKASSKILVYGAGVVGRQLVEALSSHTGMEVVGYLDDDIRIHGLAVNGKTVYNPTDLTKLIAKYRVDRVLLAMPSITSLRKSEILASIRKARVKVQTLPSLSELVGGKVTAGDIRELDIEDLLRRDPIPPIEELLYAQVRGKVIMVTGAGGSIGSELCRQLCKLSPTTLLLIEHSEFSLYEIYEELTRKHAEDSIVLVPLLVSVLDSKAVREIISTWIPATIYHAAAYKHVPLVEHNLISGIKNNVLGTWYVAQAALDYKVSNFVLVSTDKAVRPTNIMGATKRLSELILQAIATQSQSTLFCMVRFGNVLDSSGSVVPKFRKQLRGGGPITLTHPEVTRYFMTIPEAAQLVIQAGAMSQGGDVFVLDMGNPIKIKDLACQLIELSGLTIRTACDPSGDIEIVITGLRPGEKLYEELMVGENVEQTPHPRILREKEDYVAWARLEAIVRALQISTEDRDVLAAVQILKEAVVDFSSNSSLVDWTYSEQQKTSLVEKIT